MSEYYISKPNVHLTLISIDEKLRNLENTLNVQCTAAMDGKIDYYGRKINNIEKDLSRFQIFMRMELDKISENISSKNFKDDIVKDRTVRKIDAIYERLNHKMDNIEGQIDIINIKSQNAREMVMSKLEKIEESLTIRDADMEAELADAVAAIDDLKSTCSNMEENIINTTRETTKVHFKSSEKAIKKYYSQAMNIVNETNKNLLNSVNILQGTVGSLSIQIVNTSDVIRGSKAELDENLNEYANKITDMYTDMWKKTDTLENTVQTLAKVANLTRSEQQNGMRALMVQIGRKSGKQNVQSDFAIDNQKLTELSQKIDTNFENVMLAQNLFLESCHRVQMDESQLESQISVVLDKLIDIFENRTSVGPKDIEQLGHLIRTHDSNIRRSIYHITNNLLALTQKTTDGHDAVIDHIGSQKLQLEAIYMLLQDILSSSNSSQPQIILTILQDIQQQLNATHQQTQKSSLQTSFTDNFINQLLNTSFTFNHKKNNATLQQILEFIKNIYHILTTIEMKINKSYLDYFFNKYNIDAVAHRFGKNLNSYIHSMEGNMTKQKSKTFKNNFDHGKHTSELFLQAFEQTAVDPYNDYPYTIGSNTTQNFNVSEEGIDNIVLLCNSANTSTRCGKLNTTKYTTVTQNKLELVVTPMDQHSNITNTSLNNNCLHNYIGSTDVKTNDDTATPNCTLIDSDVLHQNETSSVMVFTNQQWNTTKLESSNFTNSNNSSSNNCLPNYTDLIDVRSNDGEDTPNCTLINSTGINHNETIPVMVFTHQLWNTTYLGSSNSSNSSNSSSSNCLPNYIDLIDVRSSGGSAIPNCTSINSANDIIVSNSTENKNPKHTEPAVNQSNSNNNCSFNYRDLIDVRSNNGTSDASNCTLVNSTTDVHANNFTTTAMNTNFGKINNTLNDLLMSTTDTAITQTIPADDINTISSNITTLEEMNTATTIISEQFYDTATEELTTKTPPADVLGDLSFHSTLFNGINDILHSSGETTEENYELHSQEDDFTETSNDFEYTNHEYH